MNLFFLSCSLPSFFSPSLPLPSFFFSVSPFIIYLFIYLFWFLGPHLWYMEVPRLGVESELQLPAFTTATEDPSHVCTTDQNSWQCLILNPRSKVRDWAWNLMVPSLIYFRCATMGTPQSPLLIFTHKHLEFLYVRCKCSTVNLILISTLWSRKFYQPYTGKKAEPERG